MRTLDQVIASLEPAERKVLARSREVVAKEHLRKARKLLDDDDAAEAAARLSLRPRAAGSRNRRRQNRPHS